MERSFIVKTGVFENDVDLVLYIIPFKVISLIRKIATLASRTQKSE
jgi:hypothetical protein